MASGCVEQQNLSIPSSSLRHALCPVGFHKNDQGSRHFSLLQGYLSAVLPGRSTDHSGLEGLSPLSFLPCATNWVSKLILPSQYCPLPFVPIPGDVVVTFNWTVLPAPHRISSLINSLNRLRPLHHASARMIAHLKALWKHWPPWFPLDISTRGSYRDNSAMMVPRSPRLGPIYSTGDSVLSGHKPEA